MRYSWRQIGLIILSALATQAAFAPGNHVYLAFFSLIPLFFVTERGKYGFLPGFIWGFAYSLASVYWLSMNSGTYLWIAILSTILAAVFLALQYGVFTLIIKRCLLRNKTLTLLMIPFLWTALEILRSYGSLGFPFIALGHSQAFNTAYIQAADIGGVYLISFLLLVSNISLYSLLAHRNKRALIPLLSVVFLPFIYGFIMLSADMGRADSRVFRTIQPAIGAVEKWIPQNRTPIVKKLDSLSLSAGYDSIDVVVWPESAAPLYLRSSAYHKHLIQGCVNTGEFSLVTGALDYIRDQETNRFNSTNSMFVFEPHQFLDFNQVYDKIHLVPFGEYTPGGNLLSWLNNMNYGQSDFVSRKIFDPLYVGKDSIPFTPVICYDSVFPHTIQKITNNGSRYLIVSTNDVWFGLSRGPYHHAALSIVRAVEMRRPLVRSANAGISMMIDAKGRVLCEMGLKEKGLMDQRLTSPDYDSFYMKSGLFFPLIFILITLFLTGVICFKNKK